MEKELDETLNKILEKLYKLEDGQLKFNQQIESLVNKVENLSLNLSNNNILNSHTQQLKFLKHKVMELEEEIYILKNSKALGK